MKGCWAEPCLHFRLHPFSVIRFRRGQAGIKKGQASLGVVALMQITLAAFAGWENFIPQGTGRVVCCSWLCLDKEKMAHVGVGCSSMGAEGGGHSGWMEPKAGK